MEAVTEIAAFSVSLSPKGKGKHEQVLLGDSGIQTESRGVFGERQPIVVVDSHALRAEPAVEKALPLSLQSGYDKPVSAVALLRVFHD